MEIFLVFFVLIATYIKPLIIYMLLVSAISSFVLMKIEK